MYDIPTTVNVDGVEYSIRNDGDFRIILDCFQALNDSELTATERLLAALIIFYKDFTSIYDFTKDVPLDKLVEGMYNFFNCGSSSGTASNKKLVDWQQDEQLICSAINKVANKEIRLEKYVHWWTFMGYFTAIGESPISTIIHIRDKIVSGKKLEKYERQYRMQNPQYFAWNSKSIDQNEADKLVRDIWNSNSGG